MPQCTPIPTLSTNYVWVLGNPESTRFYVVDPGDAEPVIAYFERRQQRPEAVLITHTHADHVGGVEALTQRYRNLPVIGPAGAWVNRAVNANSGFELWPGATANVLHLPGHTPEHIAFFIQGSALSTPLLFCGDVLFSSGCGRMFSGPAEVFAESLDAIRRLPDHTLLFPAHEYTLQNIEFARHLEPDNEELVEKARRCQDLVAKGACTLPTTLATEKATNPFLRLDCAPIVAAASRELGRAPIDGAETFAVIRALKDAF